MRSFDDAKTSVLADVLSARRTGPTSRLLVVGCGNGIEAAVLAQRLGVAVTGVDINPDFDPRAAAIVDLRQGDATRMEFEDASFDLAYSFHVLEHIPDYRAALREIRRVLKPGAGYLIGTPNRDRLVGYLGCRNTSLGNKIRWNLADWKAKLRAEFTNEQGAHAGFVAEELRAELSGVFANAESITDEYYLRLYERRRFMVSALCRSGLSRWLFPAVYFYGTR